MSTYIDISYSCSKPELACVEHTYLELNVNFDRKVLEGNAILSVVKKPSVTEIILDNYKLNISNVKDFDTKENLNYYLGDNTNFGSPFTIQLQQIAGVVDTRTEYKIQIEYETNPESPALIWLNAEQTADGKHPFMLSNNKMTFARSVFPCQDTPSVKSTYSAKITVLSNFTVIMSARFVELLRNDQSRDICTYHFQQIIPISSYAVVIAVGFLRQKIIGSKSYVFAEDKFFQKSIKTFADIDEVLLTAENLCGRCAFDTYDICVLPPSISFLKIDCPNVTFVSPILLGDISISCVIVLNMANNWAGNLVTCKNYNHLWLHDSFSIFIYMRIINKLLIRKKLTHFAQFLIKTQSGLFQERIMKKKNISFPKSLIPNLEDMLPNDFEQYVPYEYGFILLCELEELLGGPSVFEPFFKSFFSEFAYGSITTDDWLKFLYESFPDKTMLLNSIDWNTRFFSTSFIEKYDCKDIAMSMLEIEYSNIVNDWDKWDDNSKYIPLTFLDVKTSLDFWKLYFLRNLYPLNMTTTKLKTMSLLYDFQSDVHSYAIRHAWLLLCIKNRWEENVSAALDFAIECCIPDYVCSIFQVMYNWPEKHSQLNESYTTIKTKLLRETQSELESILHLK